MNNYNEQLKNAVHLSARERKGALLISLIGIASVLTYAFWPKTATETTTKTSFEAAAKQLQEQQKARKSDETYADQTTTSLTETPDTEPQTSAFDPNTDNLSALIRAGVPERAANSIVKYRSKGGKFKSPDDLAKIYTLPKADFERLRPYVRMAGSTPAVATAVSVPKMAHLSAFDPNTADEAQLLSLGLPPKTVTSMLNYRSKGGKFRNTDDLAKMYALSKADFERIAPYAVFESQATAQAESNPNIPKSYNQTFTRKSAPAPASLDINSATETDWATLPGIGGSYARKIVNFRQKLGGFASVEQVKETFGLPDSTYQKIAPHLRGSAIFRKIAVNTATLDDLKMHPYIGNKQAEAIIRYRANHSGIKDAAALRSLPAFPKDVLDRLLPYLSFE